MRRSKIISSALVATAALALAPNVWADHGDVTKLHCEFQAISLGVPDPTGRHLATTSCTDPFGDGLHFAEYTVTSTSPGHGTVAGTFKNFYDEGTTRGTVALTFAAADPMNITYTGTVKYTGGTGEFKHVRGRGVIACTTADGALHKSCKVDAKLRGI